MRFFDYLTVAFKNLTRQKGRSLLTIIAVMIGAISVIIMLSLVLGARSVFQRQIEAIGGLTLISVSGDSSRSGGDDLLDARNNSNPDTLRITDATITDIKTIPHVLGATPLGSIWANSIKLAGTDKKSSEVSILAIDPTAQVLTLSPVAGRALVKGDMGIVIGQQTLKKMGFQDNPQDIIGQHILLTSQGAPNGFQPDPPAPTPNGPQSSDGQVSYETPVEVVGVLGGGLDDGRDFVTLDWARKFMLQKRWMGLSPEEMQTLSTEREALSQQQRSGGNSPELVKRIQSLDTRMREMHLDVRDEFAISGYSGAMLKVDQTSNVKGVADALIAKKYGVTTALDMLEGINKIFTMIGLVLGAIGGISLFVAAIGIINTMAMAIYERTREIGVMRACGATRATVRRLFTFEAAFLGFWGGAFGIGFSFALAKIGNVLIEKYGQGASLPISDLITFPLWLIAGTITFTTGIGWLAGIIPSFRAARLDPVEALRHE